MDEFMGFSIVVVIIACMAWIWRKLKDLESLIKNKDLIQQKHNKDLAASLSLITQEVINQEWERKYKAESEDKSS